MFLTLFLTCLTFCNAKCTTKNNCNKHKVFLACNKHKMFLACNKHFVFLWFVIKTGSFFVFLVCNKDEKLFEFVFAVFLFNVLDFFLSLLFFSFFLVF